jgi:ferrous iron transport protein B
LVYKVSSNTSEKNLYKIWTLLAADTYLGKIENVHEIITQEDSKCSVPKRLQITETVRRYQSIDKITAQITEKKPQLKELLKIGQSFGSQILGLCCFLTYFINDFPRSFLPCRISNDLD